MEKKETRYDRRMNWLKDHPFWSWVFIIAFVGGGLVTIITMWGNAAPRIKNFVDDIKHSISDPEARPALTTIGNYYAALNDGSIEASDFFSPHVDQFITVKNPTVEEIQSLFTTSKAEFFVPEMEILDSTFSFSKNPSGDQTVNFWGKFTCYRKSKSKYQSCLVRIEFIFDSNGKIKSLTELQTKDLKYFNKTVKLEGTVGKLTAIFNLKFDYENKRVEGTYYYPSRPDMVYSLKGCIIGRNIEVAEYTGTDKTANCTLSTNDNILFEGTMHNTDGRNLNMKITSSERVFL
jgi:hypothetical protein